jgi:hypothetical protein
VTTTVTGGSGVAWLHADAVNANIIAKTLTMWRVFIIVLSFFGHGLG